MKLRRVWLLLPILVIAAAAYANPVPLAIAGVNSATYRSMNLQSISMATNLGPAAQSGQSREFATAGPTIPSPEPATLALFGTGLIGIATLVRHRARRSAAANRQK